MSEHDNLHVESLTPASIRAAVQHMRALQGTPQPVFADRFFLADDWIFDWDGLREDDPNLFALIMQSMAENNGEGVMPPDVWDSLVDRGYLVRRCEG